MFHSLLYVLVKHWHQLYALFQLIVTSWVRRFLQDLQDRLAFWATRWSTSRWPHCIPEASLFSMLRIWHKSWRWKRGVARSPSELSTQPAMGPRHVSTSTLEDGRVSKLWSWWWNISCCFLFNMKYKQLVFFFSVLLHIRSFSRQKPVGFKFFPCEEKSAGPMEILLGPDLWPTVESSGHVALRKPTINQALGHGGRLRQRILRHRRWRSMTSLIENISSLLCLKSVSLWK